MIPHSILLHKDELTIKEKSLLGLFIVSFLLLCESVQYPWYCMVGAVVLNAVCYSVLLWSLLTGIRTNKEVPQD